MVIFRFYLFFKKEFCIEKMYIYIDVGKSLNVKVKLLKYIFVEKYFMV